MQAPIGLLINRILTTTLSSQERYNLELLSEMPVLDTTLPTRRAYADIKALGHLHLYHRQLMKRPAKRVMASHIRIALVEAREFTAELLDAVDARGSGGLTMAIKLPGRAVPKWHELRDRIGSDKPLTGYDGSSAKLAADTQAGPARPALKIAPPPGSEETTKANPKGREAPPAPASTAAATVVLKALVRFPEAGQSARYDEAVAHYGEKRALQMTLRSALAAYDSALRAGAVSEALPAYPTRPGGIRVSRAMTEAGFARASALLDPLDMMPPATLAGDICRNALVWFFARK